ncbi:hypothetical protein [Streptomyces sp. CB03911]|uniref:hypothetical protein n=1 Tax=Streptomyces sp. CB03911 TaxID=1804758 RepID=UPI00093F7463|nr:hypothetical protein [Streptomyces sp. CB03911]OKI16612.1 hypothetical protein A6A07_11430 [Streptomyces sp. CB03911]
MTRNRRPPRAAVLAAALHSWTTTTAAGDQGEPATRLAVRQGPTWEHIATASLTDVQVTRLLAALRADLVPDQPATPMQVAATLDQLLAEWRAEGRRIVRPSDLVEALPRLGCTTAELAAQLVRLVDDRYLHETRHPGTYRL